MTREQLLKIVSPAVLAAYPDKGRILVRTIELALLGMHEADPKRPQCAGCGRPRLPQAFKLCRRCLRLAQGVVVGWRVGKEPPGWETTLADAKRALRAIDHPDGQEALSILERRLSGGFDPTPGGRKCVVCALPPREKRRFVNFASTSICSDCVARLYRGKSR